jgi:16S rRNA processing protein RimM
MGNDRFKLAEITKPHGIRGQVFVRIFADDPELLFLEGITDEKGETEFFFEKLAPHKKAFLATIEGINDRNAAEDIAGTALYIDRDMLPDLEDDEVYHVDMVGMDVRYNGNSIGCIKAVVNFGAGDLVEIQRQGAKDILVPFEKQFVPTVNTDEGYIEISPPEGLMELYE